MNDIFKTMNIPQLGNPEFQTQFETFCKALIQNIQRLISVQYTKGEKGDSVVTEEYTSNYRTGTTVISTGNLDAMGMAIVSTIFGDTPQGTTRTDLYNMLNGSLATIQVGDDYYYSQGVAPGMTVDGVEYNAIEDLIKILDGPKCNGINLDITVDPVNGEAWLSSPYLFIDGRIQGLNRMVRRNGHDEEYYKTFHDFSTAIYGSAKYEESVAGQDRNNPLTWTWTMEAVPIVPKLYFDQDINEFCWEVNGQQTGITAQGIKGDDGVSPSALIAIGTKNGDKIYIDKYQYLNGQGDIAWATPNPNYPNPANPKEPMFEHPEDVPDPKDGDFALVFFNPNPNDARDPYRDAYLGRVYMSDTQPYAIIGWDDQGRCDIFESIRQHDFWRMMATINESIEGSPRGYILPADQNIHAYPDTPATKAHLAYSESNADSEGFGVLHVAPVNASDTHHNANDPQTDHTGEMVLDYNVHVQGNHSVQGVTNVNDLHVQGDAVMHQDVNVQGDVTVQGNITASNITALGKQFPTRISNTRLASMSKFKDVSYKVTRTPTNPLSNSSGKISYSVAINGTLEINIGKLSKYNTDQTIQGVHRAISEYGPNWTGVNGEKYECNQSAAYKDTGCREMSKLYDVVTYNIPFAINKKSVVNIWQDSSQASSSNLRNQVFGWPNRVLGEDFDRDHDIAGNTKSWAAQGTVSPTSIVSDEGNSNNISCRVAAFKSSLDSDEVNRSSLWSSDIDNVNSGSSYYGYIGWPWKSIQGVSMAQGAVTNINKIAEGSFAPDEDNYTISGRIHYAPLNIDIDYFFDLFTRIIESDIAKIKIWDIIEDWSVPLWYDSITYDTICTITPIGCLRVKSGNNNYIASIWNAINTKNVAGNTLKDHLTISNLDIRKQETFQDYTLLHSLVNINNQYVYREDGVEQRDDHGVITSSLVPVEPNTNINGPTGTIIKDTNISSDYMISVFDRPNNGSVEVYNSGSIESAYFDITPTMMVVSNNVKVCPNNTKDGVWTIDESNKASWKSNEPVPVSIIPYEGYIGDKQITSPGYLKIGCASPRKNPLYRKLGPGGLPTIIPEKFAMSLSGVLMYPYTPCLIMKSIGGTIDTMEDGNNDASAGGLQSGLHYISTGRMMGVNEGSINGMTSQITQQSQDWGTDDDQPTPHTEPIIPGNISDPTIMEP